MAQSTPIPLSKSSQEAFIQYYNHTQDSISESVDAMRERMEEIDKLYQRETDSTYDQQQSKQANLAGDSNKYQNITVPVVMPQVETAVQYQTSVFLTGNPIFGVVSSPQFIDAALQMETVIDNQALKGGWTKELMLFFRNGFKYNFSPLEVDWDREVTINLETDLQFSTSQGKPKEILWEGNRITCLNPYNTFCDQKVLPTEVYKYGEFAGYTTYMSRIRLKEYIEQLPDKIIANIVPAFESGTAIQGPAAGSKNYYVPEVNPDVYLPFNSVRGTNWLTWAGLPGDKRHIDYKDAYEVTVMYCKILPGEFSLKVPGRNTPQIYKLVIINHEHIIYCERQTNAHTYIPILIGQPLEDGLGYQTKALASNVDPFQRVASAYMNSIIHSRRRAITDRVLYDPSRILAAHINSDNPSAKIPVRPAAYGKNLAEAVYQFPYREDQAQYQMQQIQALLGLANTLTGQNQASQGQFVKGNKTLHEFESVMQNANGRDQMTSILLEAQVFIPLKHILKTNILQYQGGTSLYNRERQQEVDIDPIELRKSVLEFKISDGLIPSSKLINSDAFAVALQTIGSSPQIGAAYNIAPMFSYLMKTQGAKIAEFEKSKEQIAYEQALGQWQQMCQLAIDKGLDPNKQLPPQPLPEQFGYNPNGAPQNAPAA